MRKQARVGVRAALLAVSSACGVMFGCATYGNYPSIGSSADDAAVNDPNVAPMPTVAETALKHVIQRFPVEGIFLVNLPEGMTQRRAEEILRNLKNDAARLPTSEAGELPVYHVTRVGLRPQGKAQVEILRPIFGIGRPGDRAEYQPVTVKLRRTPLEAWKVDSVRVWPVGSQVPPPLFGWE